MPIALRRELLVLPGPQKSGKGFVGRAIIERARDQGRDPLILDGNRNDASLAGLFTEPDGSTSRSRVHRPDYADDATGKAWLDTELSEMEGDGRSRVLDMGGGDLVFPDYAREREVSGDGANSQPSARWPATPLPEPARSRAAIEARCDPSDNKCLRGQLLRHGHVAQSYIIRQSVLERRVSLASN